MPSATTIRRATPRRFLSVLDFDPAELERCLTIAAKLKRERTPGRRSSTNPLSGCVVAMLFEKPSLRTRTTFEIAVRELGGEVVNLPDDVALGMREPLPDVAKNLERWVDAVVMRSSAQERVVELAAAAPRLHVINALTDEEHPCQALADLLTLWEHWGSVEHRTVAFIGDGNNVATSLAYAAPMLGISVHLASPEGHGLPDRVVRDACRLARYGADVRQFRDPLDAVAGAHAVYTDVWASMGQENEASQRRESFAAYQVTDGLMEAAEPDALFMHCLPAHRGEEVTSEVLDGPRSIVFDQAENRLHTEKALLLMLMRSAGE